MLKKSALLFLWFFVTPIVLFSLVLVTNQINQGSDPSEANSSIVAETYTQNALEGQVLGVEVTDMRPIYVANFLKDTKLEPYSSKIVETADKYEIDYKLIPAIAMKESGGGNAIDEETHNAWGWENGRTNFDSWEQAIDIVGKTLKERYIDKGLVTPEQIMAVYAPPQLLTGGQWAIDINYFFSKMESL